ncbi:hypothetical protein C2E23DRAFT_158889 [Lenzites betulinus]|nr:hypothetical protein C2E23DRAFT_158889 [Lenzites betulinus]
MAPLIYYRPPAVLQEDLLHQVFEHVHHPRALAHAAIVCRGWTIPAQSALYRELEYSPLACSPREALLARTMRTRPHLRSLVRRLSLVTVWTHSPTPDLCDWIGCIPADRLQDFRWTWDRGHLLPSVLETPAMRGTRHVELKGNIYSISSIQPILDLPYLQSLALELKGDENGFLVGDAPLRLRHLRLLAHQGPSSAMDTLLSVVGPQLESLRLTSKLGDDPESDACLVSCITTHCPNLRQLDIEGLAPPKIPVPIVDQLVQNYRSLEHLRCTEGVFTSALFQAIPPGLQSLRLPFVLAHETLLLRLLKDVHHGLDNLVTLQLTGDGDALALESIVDACRARGVVFQHCSSLAG